MKYIKILLFSLFFISCNNSKYEYIGQEIIDGKVSAVQHGTVGRVAEYPKLWVQTDKVTKEIEIPFKYEGRWKVGDSCFVNY